MTFHKSLVSLPGVRFCLTTFSPAAKTFYQSISLVGVTFLPLRLPDRDYSTQG
jgi:hypothetical protein